MSLCQFTVSELPDVGELELGTSDWLTVHQDRVNQFADATDDHQWIHVDAQRAAQGPFNGTIAHGYLTLSLVPRLLVSVLEITDAVRGVNYGLEKVRFVSPVRVGSDIRLAATLREAVHRADGGVKYRVGVRIEIREHARPAMVGESIYLVYAE